LSGVVATLLSAIRIFDFFKSKFLPGKLEISPNKKTLPPSYRGLGPVLAKIVSTQRLVVVERTGQLYDIENQI